MCNLAQRIQLKEFEGRKPCESLAVRSSLAGKICVGPKAEVDQPNGNPVPC